MKFTGQITDVTADGCRYEIRGEKSVCRGFRRGRLADVQKWVDQAVRKINGRHQTSTTANAWRSPKEKRK